MQAKDSPIIQKPDGSYTFGPAYGMDTVHGIEQSHANWQAIRRAAMILLARSYDELAEPLEQENERQCEALVYLAEQIGEFLEWRKREQELLEAAHARLMLMLSQEVEKLEPSEVLH